MRFQCYECYQWLSFYGFDVSLHKSLAGTNHRWIIKGTQTCIRSSNSFTISSYFSHIAVSGFSYRTRPILSRSSVSRDNAGLSNLKRWPFTHRNGVCVFCVLTISRYSSARAVCQGCAPVKYADKCGVEDEDDAVGVEGEEEADDGGGIGAGEKRAGL